MRKQIAIITASPKIKEDSASGFLAAQAQSIFSGSGDIEAKIFGVREYLTKKQTEEAYAYMARADALIIIFPLYIFCLGGLLMRFLQDYYFYLQKLPQEGRAGKTAVYAVANCGFPEPENNTQAIRVIKSFSEKTGAEFRFGVLIGGGGMMTGARETPMVKKMLRDVDAAFIRMREEIESDRRGPAENILTRTRIPRIFYFFGGNFGWSAAAKKFGLKKKDLYARPYEPK